MTPEETQNDVRANPDNLPAASAAAEDDDDGIFMSWPGGDVPSDDESDSDETDDIGPDDPPDDSKQKKEKKKKKKKLKKRKNKDEAPEESLDDDDGTAYAFRSAADSDREESEGKKKKHSLADNEQVLSSLKHRRYTKTLSDRLLRRVLPAVLVLLLVSGFLLFFFRLQHLTFDNLTGYAPEDVFHASGLKKNMFLFSVKESEIEKRLRTKFPYIENIQVDIDLPDTVHLCFEEDCAMFYTQMYDEYFIISESMRVLARYDSPDEISENLRAVNLSSVSYAVVGHDIRFFDPSYIDFLKEFLSVIEQSPIYAKISAMDLSNRFAIRLEYENRLSIDLGSSEDLDTKLLFIKSIVEALEPDDSGIITLIDNKKATFSPTLNTEAAAASAG